MPPKFKIVDDNKDKPKIMSGWEFKLELDQSVCAICRNSLHMQSIYNQPKGSDSKLVTGKCHHAYHFECIERWIDKHKTCPMCSKKWEYI